MAEFVCEICGGKLIMQSQGIAKCEGCGMEYTKEYLQKMTDNTAVDTVSVPAPQPQYETASPPENAVNNKEPFLKRAFLCLEDGDFAKADLFCERVLNIVPENAEAYLGKLLAQCRLQKEEQLDFTIVQFEKSNNYKHIMQFGDEEFKKRLENHRLSRIYNNAESIIKKEKSEASYRRAANLLKTIPGFKDADELVKKYLENAEICRKDSIYSFALSQMSYNTVTGFLAAANTFMTVPGFKDADELSAKCLEKADICKKDSIYSFALAKMKENTATGFLAAADAFKTVPGFKDADTLRVKCLENTEIYKKNSIYYYALSQMNGNTVNGFLAAANTFKTIPGFKDADERAVFCQKRAQELKIEEEQRLKAKKRKRIKIAVFVPSTIAVVTALVILSITYFIPLIRYNSAVKKQKSGKLGDAKAIFYSLGDFKDSKDKYKKILSKPKEEVEIYNKNTIKTTEYKYDKTGNTIEGIETDSNGKVSTTEYTYDKKGNILKQVYTDEKGNKTSLHECEYSYDKSGNVILKKASLFGYGVTTTKYTYDKSGNVIKETYTGKDNDVSTREYTYDKSGNLIKETYNYKNGYEYTKEYSYDKSGNVIKETCTDKDNDVSTREYTYDKSGNLIKEIYTDEDDKVSTYEYKYDKSGNLVKEIHTDNHGGKTKYEYSDFEYFIAE